MTRIAITLTLECRDRLPPRVLEWMQRNLCRHAEREFYDDYDSAFVTPAYQGPPLDSATPVTSTALVLESPSPVPITDVGPRGLRAAARTTRADLSRSVPGEPDRRGQRHAMTRRTDHERQRNRG
jgi:hypothetical protein